jgi:hypothetical protein
MNRMQSDDDDATNVTKDRDIIQFCIMPWDEIFPPLAVIGDGEEVDQVSVILEKPSWVMIHRCRIVSCQTSPRDVLVCYCENHGIIYLLVIRRRIAERDDMTL